MLIPNFTYRYWQYRGANHLDRLITIHIGLINLDIFPHAWDGPNICTRLDIEMFYQHDPKTISRKDRFYRAAIESPYWTFRQWLTRLQGRWTWRLFDVRTHR